MYAYKKNFVREIASPVTRNIIYPPKVSNDKKNVSLC